MTSDRPDLRSAADFQPRIDPADELICLGHGEDLAAQGGALAPPIVQTSLFAHESSDALSASLEAEFEHNVYTRGQNPTVEAVEAKIARLERGEACKVVASGMAAISAVLFGSVRSGDHILFVNQVYGPTLQLAAQLERFGVEHSVALDLDLESIATAIRPNTRVVWMESPGTMLFRQLDIRALARLAREHDALSVIDNSWATPLFQKPIPLGVDLVVHSATKYLAGHSDLVAGAIITSRERLKRLFFDAYLLQGGAIGPWDAWLLNRGLRTLPVRMRGHHAGAQAVARFLVGHPRVRRVFHPRLDETENPLTGTSGLLSFEIDSEEVDELRRVIDRLKLFRIGISWGGIESLALAPFRGSFALALKEQGLPLGLIRLSVGLEPVERLIDDLAQALGPI